MTGKTVIEFHDVWKTFHRHAARMLLRSHLGRLASERGSSHEFAALKRISFRLEQGESLALIGANGAGKSTLLSLVAGLVPPDRGTVSVQGRIAALLELGSGFHPDLTGEENIRLNAALL